HELNTDFRQVFINYAQDRYDIKESIFEVEYWGNNLTGYNEAGHVGFRNGPRTNNNNTGAGFGAVAATADLYMTYQAGDQRRDWTIANFTYNNGGTSGANTMLTDVRRPVL